MITVRFPTGFSIQYNTANFAHRKDGYTDIYTQKGGELIAQIPTGGCVVEWIMPCRTYSSIEFDSDKVQASIELLSKEVRLLKRKMGRP